MDFKLVESQASIDVEYFLAPHGLSRKQNGLLERKRNVDTERGKNKRSN